MPSTDNDEGSLAREIIIDSLYAIAIGINVYLIADQLTDGAVSRKVSERWYTYKGRFGTWRNNRRQLRKDTGRMVWQAMNIVEGNDDE